MEKKIVICISGFAATGKSTLGRKLARSFQLRYISGGDGLKILAKERGYKLIGKAWWETEEGLRFLEERVTNPEFDKLVDQKLIEYAERGRVVIDSWILPWLYPHGFNIWLKASEDVRVKRLVKRSQVDPELARQILRKRDDDSAEIYRRLYGVEIGKDYSPFHLILDTSNLSIIGVYRIVLQAVKEYFKIPSVSK